MAYKLNRSDLVRALETLLKPRVKPIFVQTVALDSSQRDNLNVLVIDILEWAYYISRSRYTSLRIDRSEEFYLLYKKYEMLLLTLYTSAFSTRDNRQIISKYMTKENLDEIYKLYTLFCYNIEQVQALFFQEYKTNRTTYPVMVIPYSQSLERINRPLLVVEEKTDDGYRCSEYLINDNKYMLEDKELTNMSYYILSTKLDKSEIELPEMWLNSLTNLRPNISSYEDRMRHIKLLYQYYWSYGKKHLGDNDKECYILNFTQNLIREHDIAWQREVTIPKEVLHK